MKKECKTNIFIHIVIILTVTEFFTVEQSCGSIKEENPNMISITNAKWMFSEGDEAIISWLKIELNDVLTQIRAFCT